MAEKESKAFVDNSLLRHVKADTEEIKNRVVAVGNRVELAQQSLDHRIGGVGDVLASVQPAIDKRIVAESKSIKEALVRVERRQGEMIEALLVLLTNQGSPDPAKITELTDKLNRSAQSLNASVEANKP